MATTYATVAQLKARLRIPTATTAEDAMLQEMLDGAAAAIDLWTGKTFAPATQTRYYASEDGVSLAVDPLVSVTTLATDEDGDRTYETEWAATDYRLLPLNAVADGQPYTGIAVDGVNGRYTFPGHAAAVRVTGSFGHATVPVPIREATLRLGQRLYGLRDALLGLGGARETGFAVVIPEDVDLQNLLDPYRRWVIA